MTLSSSIQLNDELTPAITVMSRARDTSYYLQLDFQIVQCLRWIVVCCLNRTLTLHLSLFIQAVNIFCVRPRLNESGMAPWQ